MAADYCFLKFICVRESFKKHFPRLSLSAPAHHTKPPVCFSAAVNFAGLVSTWLQRGKQQLRSVQFSTLCLAVNCQDLAWFAEPPLFEVVFFLIFWHFKCFQGPQRLRTRFVRQRGQAGVTDAIAERRTVITGLGNYERGAEGETSVAGAAADPGVPGKSSSSWWCCGCFGAGMASGEGCKWELSPDESTQQLLACQQQEPKPVDVGGRFHIALVVVGSSPAYTRMS